MEVEEGLLMAQVVGLLKVPAEEAAFVEQQQLGRQNIDKGHTRHHQVFDEQVA